MDNNFLKSSQHPLNPYFITGLIDSDGSLGVVITPKPTGIGWQVQLQFSIAAGDNYANRMMFDSINLFFGEIGRIVLGTKPNTIAFVITGLQNCLIVRNHLLNYPLLTYKLVYFHLWSAIIDIMLTGAHLTWEGLLLIIAYKAHFKSGLSDLLKHSFAEYVPIPQPNYTPNLSLINMYWLIGFINGDGSFSLRVGPSLNARLGEQCFLLVSIGQHNRSLIVLESIQNFLGLGKIHRLSDEASRFQFGAIKDINSFINQVNNEGAQFLGAKSFDYADFCKAVNIVNSKTHLTKEGLELIRNLAAGMNNSRTYFGE